MFFLNSLNRTRVITRQYATSKKNFKISIVGAGGGVGESMSMILKLSPLVGELALHDLIPQTVGIAKELSHICTTSKVTAFVGKEATEEALNGCDLAVILAGESRKPGMEREELFSINAPIVKEITQSIAKSSPNAFVVLFTDPINSLIPVVCKTMEKVGKYDPNKIFGVCSLNSLRSRTFLSDLKDLNPMEVHVPVVGGHSTKTIVPLFSRVIPTIKLSDQETLNLTNQVRQAGTNVVELKHGMGASQLSMAFAGSKFIIALCRALKGDSDIVKCAYVKSDITEAKYLSTPLIIGENGISKNLGLGKLSRSEELLLNDAIPHLKDSIEEGELFCK